VERAAFYLMSQLPQSIAGAITHKGQLRRSQRAQVFDHKLQRQALTKQIAVEFID
jgi:hypothetical protein